MKETNTTRFGQLVVGEKFRLPGSEVLMIKETLRPEPRLGWVSATYDITVLATRLTTDAYYPCFP